MRDVEARKNEVEVAWREYMQAISRYCMYAGREEFYETKVAGGLYTHPLAGHFGYFGKEIDEQPEEARRAWYECKVLTDMVEEVVDKAEEFLESATKENSCGEHKDDGDDGGELGARWKLHIAHKAQVEIIAKALAEQNGAKVWEPGESGVAKPDEVKSGVNTEVNEVAPEVSTVNKVK